MRYWLTWSGMGRRMLPTLTVVGLTVIWELYVVLMDVPEYLLPAPSGVLIELLNELAYLMSHFWITALETLLGLAASVVIGVGLGVLMVVLPTLESALYPLLVASQCVPKIAIAPLLVGVGRDRAISEGVGRLSDRLFPHGDRDCERPSLGGTRASVSRPLDGRR